jgi:hypothetical protein
MITEIINIRDYAKFLVSRILFSYYEDGGQDLSPVGMINSASWLNTSQYRMLLLRPWNTFTMGVCINYTTTEAVTSVIQEAIRADLAHSQSDHSWILCEPPHLYSTETLCVGKIIDVKSANSEQLT